MSVLSEAVKQVFVGVSREDAQDTWREVCVDGETFDCNLYQHPDKGLYQVEGYRPRQRGLLCRETVMDEAVLGYVLSSDQLGLEVAS